jgi:predicted nucleotidyltransferase
MTKNDAFDKLRQHADAIKAMGATSLYVFGSVAQDRAAPGSDLDVFVDYERDGRFNAFDLGGIKLLLESELGIEVDITTRDGLHPMLRAEIERSAMRIFDVTQDRPCHPRHPGGDRAGRADHSP